MKRVGEIKPQHKDLQWFGYKVAFLVPTPLPESPTREFSSLCQQTSLWRRKPYTLMYTPQLHHNLITTCTQLLLTNLLHTNSSSHLSTSHLSSQLAYFTTNQLLLPTPLLYLLNYLLQTQQNFTNKTIYTRHNNSSTLLELGCREFFFCTLNENG